MDLLSGSARRAPIEPMRHYVSVDVTNGNCLQRFQSLLHGIGSVLAPQLTVCRFLLQKNNAASPGGEPRLLLFPVLESGRLERRADRYTGSGRFADPSLVFSVLHVQGDLSR